nr:immunoglobulin heavy chain junction region [Mus musculus]
THLSKIESPSLVTH